jgi:hypothetical protein
MLIEATTEIGSRITGAIQEAARATGAGFDYLLKAALRESNFDPSSRATTSSATGLFQFIDQTWLSTVKESGPQLGYGRYADSIVKTSSGNYAVPDASARSQVMKLRYDPTANAVMAGAFTQRNAAQLEGGLGRKPSQGELYIAHVLGPGGAVKLISAAARTPQARAADLFPGAARANRPIFYNRQGGARSVAQVYDVLSGKMNGAVPGPASAQPAQPAPPPAVAAIAAATAVASVAQAGAAPSSAAASSPPVVAYAAERSPMFQGLFRTDRREPVSPVVAELWGAAPSAKPQLASAVAPVPPPSGSTSTTGRIGKPLDLFQFLRPEIRAAARPSS